MDTAKLHEEQTGRAERYYRRFERLYMGVEDAADVAHFMDDVYTFFLHCYHIKDWLKNDPDFTAHSASEIENYVSTTPCLAMVADICNAAKHLRLTKHRSPGHAQITGRRLTVSLHDSLNGSALPTTYSVSVEVSDAGTEHDAFHLATQAMAAWRSLL